MNKINWKRWKQVNNHKLQHVRHNGCRKLSMCVTIFKKEYYAEVKVQYSRESIICITTKGLCKDQTEKTIKAAATRWADNVLRDLHHAITSG